MDRFEDAKLRIKEGNDLVALIEQYQPLRPRGRTLVSLCPFHAENSPSFTVFKETQHFHCFGCGKTGDVFTWLMERDGLSFREAMEVLGERAGVSLEGVFQKGPGQESQKKARTAYEALAQIADFFHRSLLTPEGEGARKYLEDRNLDEAIVPWTLGYHPYSGNALMKFARENKVPIEVLEQSGLLKNGREMFAGRLIFPILDERGRTVAFGGRLVPGGPASEPRGDYTPPKYLNSPESPFFHKRRVLYGLRAAKQAGQRRLIVMEGYTDVIACHMAGFEGAVASLGTAFTADHARIVERYADQGVVLMFDGDRAGKQACERAHRELINSRLMVRIALVSDGSEDAKDPADIVLARGDEDEELVIERRARFADTIDGAQDAMTVWFRLLRQRFDFTQPVNVEAAARECAALLEKVEVPVRQAALMEAMARHLAVPPQALEKLVRAPQRRRPQSQGQSSGQGEPEPDYDDPHFHGEQGEMVMPDLPDGHSPQAARGPSQGKPTKLELAEAEILACVLAQPDLLVGIDFDETPLQVREIEQLVEWAVEALAIGRDSGAGVFRYLFTRATDHPRLQKMLAIAHARAEKMKEPAEVLAGIMAGRRQVVHGSKRRSLREQYLAAIKAGDKDTAAELQQQMLDSKRQERPRKGFTGASEAPIVSNNRKPPVFGFAAKAAAAGQSPAPEEAAPATEVSAPEASAPEASAPEASAPEASAPEEQSAPASPDAALPESNHESTKQAEGEA